MRGFWLDVKNLQHKKEVPLLGERQICVAGVEIAARDTQGGIKNFMIAASSLGNASVYFENNSASGLGGFTGGAASGPVREKALRMMQSAAAAAAHLQPVDSLPPQQNVENVTLFTVSGEGQILARELKESEVRNPENDLYAFFAYSQQLLGAFRFAYSQQLLGAFRAEQEQASAAAEKTTSAAGSAMPAPPAPDTKPTEN